ncbi:ribonuclease HII [candidate division WS5 bacterium]|uniref:Ribonuclease HII n=1 Tax=candidate division WS5 bacterium TaxID=2093353 RepID=A0A419DAG3_9BACT|nr:MAG: ribonuclease HII [candidate division WS5 bacterium]
MKPDLKHEKKYWAEGLAHVCGVDEVGRGCWAGPLYVGAVLFDKSHTPIKGVNDSKKLTAKRREALYKDIIKEAMSWSTGVAEVHEIDRYGLTVATKMAIQRAVGALSCPVDILLIDAFSHDKIKSVGIIKGDEVCYSIACASIVAKVERDRHISALPESEIYRLDKNKGYGTKEHQELIKKHGVSDIHRKSFKPIEVLL